VELFVRWAMDAALRHPDSEEVLAFGKGWLCELRREIFPVTISQS